MNAKLDEFLKHNNACASGVLFCKNYNSFVDAWKNCHRGDWLLWIASTLAVDIRILTLAKGLCAQTVMHLMPDDRSKEAVRAAIDFGNGKIDLSKLNHFADAAYAAAYAADAYAYADAAARKENQRQTADICREILTKEVFAKYVAIVEED